MRKNILMLGGKRCGKTTVLSSMLGQINMALAGTNMRLDISDAQSSQELQVARNVIKSKLNDFNTPLTRVEVDENPSSALKQYGFTLRAGNGISVPICISDIPGEWLTDQHQNDVKQLVRQSDVIIIAIDTPYLFSKMTDKGYGVYHEEYNKPLEIANFFKNSLSIEDIAERMILFVPIKCERYYHLTYTPQLNVYQRNYMQELINAVGCGYRELLQYLRSTQGLINSCTIAITPILSAGGIDFVRFRKDEQTGRIVSLYQKPEFLRDSEQGYTPRFCEQPMVYALCYLLAQSRESFWSGRQRQDAIETLRKKMKRNTGNFSDDGYYIIQNPKGL